MRTWQQLEIEELSKEMVVNEVAQGDPEDTRENKEWTLGNEMMGTEEPQRSRLRQNPVCCIMKRGCSKRKLQESGTELWCSTGRRVTVEGTCGPIGGQESIGKAV